MSFHIELQRQISNQISFTVRESYNFDSHHVLKIFLIKQLLNDNILTDITNIICQNVICLIIKTLTFADLFFTLINAESEWLNVFDKTTVSILEKCMNCIDIFDYFVYESIDDYKRDIKINQNCKFNVLYPIEFAHKIQKYYTSYTPAKVISIVTTFIDKQKCLDQTQSRQLKL